MVGFIYHCGSLAFAENQTISSLWQQTPKLRIWLQGTILKWSTCKGSPVWQIWPQYQWSVWGYSPDAWKLGTRNQAFDQHPFLHDRVVPVTNRRVRSSWSMKWRRYLNVNQMRCSLPVFWISLIEVTTICKFDYRSTRVDHRFPGWKSQPRAKSSCALCLDLRRESGFISGLVAALHDTTEQGQGRATSPLCSNVKCELRTPLDQCETHLKPWRWCFVEPVVPDCQGFTNENQLHDAHGQRSIELVTNR